ncbi:hypothetical protein RSAG8_11391, partial [Rhizoctonia solani AG-8 WAC10335]
MAIRHNIDSVDVIGVLLHDVGKKRRSLGDPGNPRWRFPVVEY